jgi:hypothetical protein
LHNSAADIILRHGGKKELTGCTDIEIEISNQFARLIANASPLALITQNHQRHSGTSC